MLMHALAARCEELRPRTGNPPLTLVARGSRVLRGGRGDLQPRTQGICSWGAKYPGMAWSRDPRILRKMAYCLLGSGE